MLFKALFILLCFVVMFGCLDAVSLWGKRRSSSSSSTKKSSSTNKSSSLSSNDQAGSNRSAKPSANANSRDEQQSNQSTKGEPCTICQDALSNGTSKKTLRCKHKFHRDCINPWLVDHNTCPICRQPVTDELAPGRTAPTNENEQQTTQHQHTITGGTQTFPHQPWQIAPSSENGGWESYQHLLNDQRNNEHGQSYNGGQHHYWDQAQNQGNVWEEQYLQEYGQQNQGWFNDNYNVADAALDTVGLIVGGIGRVVTAAGNYLNGTQDSEQMYTSQSVYDNPPYHAGPSLTTGPYGQPAHGQGMHMRDPYGHMDTVHAPYCPQHHGPQHHGPQHHAPYCPHHHPMN